jgi:DNA (cytosine-5)-methyltransferase 1
MQIEVEAARWRTLDLFCGAAGGWTLGLHHAGFLTVAACEIDPWRRAIFGRNNPGILLYDDVRTLGADRIRRDLGFLPKIVCGSPPCQDASAANAKGRGIDGERTGLFFDALRVVREVRPRWVLLENVPGLRTRGYDRVHDALEQAGYAIWPLVVGAVHAGAPHLRKRVWMVAADAECDEGRWFEQVRLAAKRSAIFAGNDAETNAAVAATMQRPSLARGEPDRNRTETVADAESCARRSGLCEIASIGDGPLAANCSGEAASDPDKSGLEERGRAESDGPEHASAFDLLGAFRQWNGGPPDFGRVDDGISEALASRRGIGRACLAAYGDAVLPQITEAIGRAIKSLDRAEF